MKRTQISLDSQLYEALRRAAYERRISMASVVRDALAEYLGQPSARRRSDDSSAPRRQERAGLGGYE
jgi:metal-responsive CopG/Arc/MetJ family transcriptional regulator